jgi:hypothetical protein
VAKKRKKIKVIPVEPLKGYESDERNLTEQDRREARRQEVIVMEKQTEAPGKIKRGLYATGRGFKFLGRKTKEGTFATGRGMKKLGGLAKERIEVLRAAREYAEAAEGSAEALAILMQEMNGKHDALVALQDLEEQLVANKTNTEETLRMVGAARGLLEEEKAKE